MYENACYNFEFLSTGPQYKPKMSTLIYSLLYGYTSSGQMNQVIQDIAHVTGMSVTVHDIPSRSTIERMQLELGLIRDIQVIVYFYLTTVSN